MSVYCPQCLEKIVEGEICVWGGMSSMHVHCYMKVCRGKSCARTRWGDDTVLLIDAGRRAFRAGASTMECSKVPCLVAGTESEVRS